MDRTDLIVDKGGGLTFPVDSKSPLHFASTAKLIQSIGQDDYVSVVIESATPLTFNLNDKMLLGGMDYMLNLTPVSRKRGNRLFVYDLKFEGAVYLLRKIAVFNRDSQNRQTDYDFYYHADLEGHIDMIITNANINQSIWSKGSIPSGTDFKTVMYNNQNCLTAMHDLTALYGVEFYVTKDGGGYKINIGNRGVQTAYTFEYGKGKGLYSLRREAISENEVVTRLYGFGSTENLPIGYRSFSRRLRMPAATGDYIEDQLMINQFGYVEKIYETDIRPEFIGEITSVGALTQETAMFSSTDMDFDLAELDQDDNTVYIPDGEKAKVHFLTGRLAGYEFDVYSYNHGSKTFEIDVFTDNRGQSFPDNSTFAIEQGDLFTLSNIFMPQSYIDDAEQRLQDAVETEYERLSKTNIKYTLEVDPLFMRGKTIELGDEIYVKDTDIGVDRFIRILGLEFDILTQKYIFTMSDVWEISLRRRLITTLHGAKKEVKKVNDRAVIQDLNNHVEIRDFREKVLDKEGYLNPTIIKEKSISIKMLKEDARPRQAGADGVVYEINEGGDSNALKITAGDYTHFSIDEGQIKTWSMPQKQVSGLDPSDSYYVYVKAERATTDAEYVVTTNQYNVDEDEDYYYFLTGVLYRPDDGKRNMDVIHGALPEKSDGKPIVEYYQGAATDIQLPFNIPGLLDLTDKEQLSIIRLYRNGILMKVDSSGTGITHIRIDENLSGGQIIIPAIPFTNFDELMLLLFV